jgi:Flp pilus assembly protein TadB
VPILKVHDDRFLTKAEGRLHMSHDLNWVGAGLLASLLIFGVIQLLMSRQHARHHHTARKQFPEMLDLLVQSLKGGADLPTALGVVAEMGLSPGNRAFAHCRDRIVAGVPIAEALPQLDDGCSSFAINYLTAVLETKPHDPERIRQALIRMEQLNRHAALIAAEIDHRFASIQTTSIAVFVLVPVMAVLLMVFSPWYQKNLEHHVSGQILLFGAILLYAVGGIWMFSIWNRQKQIRYTWQDKNRETKATSN